MISLDIFFGLGLFFSMHISTLRGASVKEELAVPEILTDEQDRQGDS